MNLFYEIDINLINSDETLNVINYNKNANLLKFSKINQPLITNDAIHMNAFICVIYYNNNNSYDNLFVPFINYYDSTNQNYIEIPNTKDSMSFKQGGKNSKISLSNKGQWSFIFSGVLFG